MEEGLYYPYSENKGADQLRGYREADLRFCFRICKNPVFSRRDSYGFCESQLARESTSETLCVFPRDASDTRAHA